MKQTISISDYYMERIILSRTIKWNESDRLVQLYKTNIFLTRTIIWNEYVELKTLCETNVLNSKHYMEQIVFSSNYYIESICLT